MVESDRQAFGTAIGAMLETFGQQATKPILLGYWLGLKDLTLDALQYAVACAIQQSERVPRPADLRRFAGEKTNDQRAIAAWDDVLKAVPFGSYKHVDFADKLINATIRNLGGWPGLLDRFDGSEGEKWARIEFLKAYATMAAGGVNGEACAALPGLAQATAIGGVVQDPVPVQIACDIERARLAEQVNRPAINAAHDVPVIAFKRA